MLRPTNAEPRPLERYTSSYSRHSASQFAKLPDKQSGPASPVSSSSAKAWPYWWLLSVCHCDHGSHGKEPQRSAHYVMENLHCPFVFSVQVVFRTSYHVSSKILSNLTHHGFISCNRTQSRFRVLSVLDGEAQESPPLQRCSDESPRTPWQC